jgi:hypothetical protein
VLLSLLHLKPPTKRGFEGFIGEIDTFFPSTNDLLTSAYSLNQEGLDVGIKVLEDIGKRYTKNTHRLLEYWRRGFELGEMWYFSEAYLNYFKILELMAKQVNTGSDPRFIALRDRFNTTSFKQRYGFNKKDIYFAAKIFAFWGNRKTTVAMFRSMCKIAKIRNHYNVGHTRAASQVSYYSAIGQFSDEFDITQHEGEFLRELTRLLILNSLGYTNYWLDGAQGIYLLKTS